MSKIIGVLNYKGGTGKTTTVVNLAAGLALRGSKVLCIDLDTQGGVATSLGVQSDRTVAHLLLGYAEPEACIVQARENLDVIISDVSLLQVEGQLWRMNDAEKARRLLLKRMEHVNGYDYIILDHSPSISRLSHNGLFYINQVIIPVSMDYLALVGIRQVLQTIKTIGQTSEHNLQLSLIVPTFYYGHLRKDREIIQTLHQHFADKVARPIRSNVKLSESASYQKSIYEYAPRSSGAIDYAQLVERVSNG
jgi:chromosome partitioning protein